MYKESLLTCFIVNFFGLFDASIDGDKKINKSFTGQKEKFRDAVHAVNLVHRMIGKTPQAMLLMHY
ncbi:hypothetical protein HCUR_00002 [Holospora curviuscula]|uniref:Uncharacterized protein n=1 Tax=Holospora curviuscula TaxID=1082868 RepID=A0A2S5RI05_9PROT|nr:hypothetical protein HCUR_00002 [Holospora curviuscula]